MTMDQGIMEDDNVTGRSSFIPSTLFPGVPLALGAAALFGLTPAASKLLLSEMPPLMLAGLMYLGAGVGLGLILLVRRVAGARAPAEAPLGKADLPWAAAAFAAGGIVGPVLLMFGLSHMAASGAALLLNLESVATLLIAWLVFGENAGRRLVLGALAIVAGAVLLSFWNGGWNGSTPGQPFGRDEMMGAALVAGACLAWGIDNNLTRKISGADPVAIAALKGLVAGSTNVALALALGAPLPGPAALLAAGGLGFVAIGLSLVMFIRALRHLGTARTGAYFALAPFLGALFAVVFVHEPVTWALVLAGGLMGLGFILHITERHEHMHHHEAMAHAHAHTHDAHHQHSHEGLDPALANAEPHSHWHRHEPQTHSHPHYPDLHHRHEH